MEAVHRLANLPNRPTFQRERVRIDHGLVAVVEGVQPVPGVQIERTLRDAEDRKAPPPPMRGPPIWMPPPPIRITPICGPPPMRIGGARIVCICVAGACIAGARIIGA